MRVAALYDIHGNVQALEAVLADVMDADVDVIVVGGDVASGPFPAQTLDRLSALGEPVRFVRGNAEREVIDAYERLTAGIASEHDDPAGEGFEPVWVAGQLTATHRELLATFSPSVTLDVDGLGEVHFCHGSPRSDEDIITAATSDARLEAMLESCAQRVVVGGHTHVQLDRATRAHRVVNAGSVGMPYEDSAGAYWALLGPDVELRCTAYDYASAAASILASGHPWSEDIVKECLLEPIGRAAAIEHFEGISSKRTPPNA
jgi:predicted phosphodiesterase